MQRELQLQTGRNCWEVFGHPRARLLIDADSYFFDLEAELRRARHSVFVIGWDIDSRVRLTQDGLTLAELFDELVRGNSKLRIHLLIWDPAAFYYLERERLTAARLGWGTHGRVIFHRDDEHPLGASQHQKIVVIDDRVAYCGGIDLTANRWDNSAHDPENPDRKNPWGKGYGPFHDVQIRVEGPAARKLGEMARIRWEWAGAPERTEPAEISEEPREAVELHRDALEFKEMRRIALARTLPRYKGNPEVREVEKLYLDLVQAARSVIYIENQFLTSGKVSAALARSLKSETGPEVIIVLPQGSGNIIEEKTMGPRQSRMLRHLQRADRGGRLGIFSPCQENGTWVKVHAKIMIVDGRWVRVGSANLANRSMGLDSECDVLVETSEAEGRKVLLRFLSEHLGENAEGLDRAIRNQGSVLDVIRRRSDGRRLVSLEPESGERTDELISELDIIDMERSIEDEALAEDFTFDRKGRPGRLLRSPAVISGLGLGLFILAVVLVWVLTPLEGYLNQAELSELLTRFRESPAAPLWVLGTHLLAGLFFVPVNLLIIATATVFQAPLAIAYALGGSLLNALAGYAVGRAAGVSFLDRLLGGNIKRLADRFARRGVLPVIVVRMLPVAPFTVVNLIGGAARLHLTDFLLGTLIGLAPGVLSLVFFQRSLIAFLREPGWDSVGMLAVIVALIVGGLHFVKKRFGSERS